MCRVIRMGAGGKDEPGLPLCSHPTLLLSTNQHQVVLLRYRFPLEGGAFTPSCVATNEIKSAASSVSFPI